MAREKQPVSLNIKNPEVYRAASRLAELRGVTITAAVLDAVQAALRRQERGRRGDNEVRRMAEFARRISAMPVLDSRPEDEILGYGPEGYLVGD